MRLRVYLSLRDLVLALLPVNDEVWLPSFFVSGEV